MADAERGSLIEETILEKKYFLLVWYTEFLLFNKEPAAFFNYFFFFSKLWLNRIKFAVFTKTERKAL